MEYGNEILTFLVGVIGVLTFTTTAYRWKISQIRNDTKRRVSINNITNENQKHIHELKLDMSEMRERISSMEGAFHQHNKERGKHSI